MGRISAVLLSLALVSCGKLNCASSPTDGENRCGEPYGLFCMNIEEYRSAGYDVCQDAEACGIATVKRLSKPYQCNPGSTPRP